MAVKPGIGTSFNGATLDGYPGMIVDFSATQRDLADMHGMLGLILTPWGQVVPVSCASDHAPSVVLESLCEQVITSVTLRRKFAVLKTKWAALGGPPIFFLKSTD